MNWKAIVGTPVLACVGLGLGFFGRDFVQGDFSLRSAGYLTSPTGVSPSQGVDPKATFEGAFKDISLNYYRPVKNFDLKHAAMGGLMSSLGDPHTIFMNPVITEDFLKDTQGSRSYSGIGARLQADPAGVKLVTIFRDSPARKAGLEPSDIVVGVNGKSIAGMEVDNIVTHIKGPEGSTVSLKIMRPSAKRTFDVTVIRKQVNVPTADSMVLEGTDIGYLPVYGFASVTPEQFDQALNDLNQKGIKGLVIDLRGNPGGLLESAATMLSEFVENKLVVTTEGREEGTTKVYTKQGLMRNFPYPVVVLVNEESASASEIFAGVMHDYRLATLVGEHTYGKASVQRLFNLPDGASAKITIAKYSLPSGYDMRRRVDDDGQYISGGLKPDVEVKLNLGPNTAIGNPVRDNQLAKAIEVIRSKSGH